MNINTVEKYETLINQTICDTLYAYMKENTNYTNLNNFCQNISNAILNNITPTNQQYKIINHIINTLIILYDESKCKT